MWAGLGRCHGTAGRAPWLCSPCQPFPVTGGAAEECPPLPPFLPLSQLECAQHGQAVTAASPGLALLLRGRPRTHHGWKSDLYLKYKKSIKPQMLCNKPLVLSCPNTRAVSLLPSVGTPGSPSGLAATSPAPVPAGNVTAERDHCPQQALLRLRVFQPPLPPAPAGRGCPCPG